MAIVWLSRALADTAAEPGKLVSVGPRMFPPRCDRCPLLTGVAFLNAAFMDFNFNRFAVHVSFAGDGKIIRKQNCTWCLGPKPIWMLNECGITNMNSRVKTWDDLEKHRRVLKHHIFKESGAKKTMQDLRHFMQNLNDVARNRDAESRLYTQALQQCVPKAEAAAAAFPEKAMPAHRLEGRDLNKTPAK